MHSHKHTYMPLFEVDYGLFNVSHFRNFISYSVCSKTVYDKAVNYCLIINIWIQLYKLFCSSWFEWHCFCRKLDTAEKRCRMSVIFQQWHVQSLLPHCDSNKEVWTVLDKCPDILHQVTARKLWYFGRVIHNDRSTTDGTISVGKYHDIFENIENIRYFRYIYIKHLHIHC